MAWLNRRVLVTGAGGFIGSHLVERLVKEGARVTAFLRYNSRGDHGCLVHLAPEVFGELEIVRGDLKDPYACRRALDRVEVVFHLAALIGIPYSYVNPIDYVQTNVLGTSFLLKAALDAGVGRFVHTSTSEVYGTARTVPIDETHPLQPQSPYSASKIAADQMALSFYHGFGLPVAVLRPFNTYGPRQSTRAVIPTVITQALSQPRIELGALSPTRDLTYVEDTVAAFLAIATADGAVGQVINVGNNREISIGDLAARILAIMEVDKEIVCREERLRPRSSEVERLRADAGRAAALMGWRPQVSLDQGLRRTIDWIRQRLGEYQVRGYHV